MFTSHSKTPAPSHTMATATITPHSPASPPSTIIIVIGHRRWHQAEIFSNSNDFHKDKGESQSADRPREEILLVCKGCLIALLVDEEEDLVPEACDPKQGNDRPILQCSYPLCGAFTTNLAFVIMCTS